METMGILTVRLIHDLSNQLTILAGNAQVLELVRNNPERLSKVIDHPLVSEILAAGALAAVAAVAEHQLGNTNKTASSSKLIQAAGKAAAAAIGARLMNEVGAIRDAATKAARKS